jgi:dihydrolipoamide dehydrogenase
MDFAAVPHAVFTEPQIASIGLTESRAAKDHDIIVGKASYADTVQGDVRKVEAGFAKAVIERKTGRILGFHIIGPDASILIQEVVNVFTQKGDYRFIADAMHIFPSLSDLITETLGKA